MRRLQRVYLSPVQPCSSCSAVRLARFSKFVSAYHRFSTEMVMSWKFSVNAA